MEKPLPQLLHESLKASPNQVCLSAAAIQQALEGEADRVFRQSYRWFLLSTIPVMLIPSCEKLLSGALEFQGWGMLAIIACLVLLALKPSWGPYYRRLRSKPFPQRFREAAILRAMTCFCSVAGALFLALIMLKHAGVFVELKQPNLGGWPPLFPWLSLANALVCGLLAAVFVPRLVRRLDPYWFS